MLHCSKKAPIMFSIMLVLIIFNFYHTALGLLHWKCIESDMGSYHCIALYMFTHDLQVNMCFLYVQTRHKCYSVTYVRSCCRINILFTEYRETSLVWCRIVTRAYDTCDNIIGNKLWSSPVLSEYLLGLVHLNLPFQQSMAAYLYHHWYASMHTTLSSCNANSIG